MRKYLTAVSPFLCMALLAGCGLLGAGKVERSDKPYNPSPAVVADDLETLAAGNNAFAFDLYQRLRQEEGNLFLSPYSISSALAMTYAGARGETETEMAQTLHFTLPQEKLHPAFSALNSRLVASEENDSENLFRLHIANALWGQDGYAFLPEFLDALSINYDAGLRLVDYVQDTEGARKTINRWVEKETEGKIEDLIAPGVLDQLTRLVLTNAIYFKSKWASPFEAKETKPGPFNLIDGSQVEVPMMAQTGHFPYAKGEGWQAVELPYRKQNFSMQIILPDAGRFAEIEESLDAEMAKKIIAQLEGTSIDLKMPKFEFASKFSLAELLSTMGMPSAFDNADFSGITGSRDLFIAAVIHKAFVAVDEEGTEAAAATAVAMKLASALAGGRPRVILDRPFIFLIRDANTGATLFVGRVMNPAP